MDQHHRRAHAHAGDHALEGPLIDAVEMADIGRGAAHVEADDAVKPAMRAVSTAPTTPPAGPERMASLPLNRCAEVSPPEDCMNRSFGEALAPPPPVAEGREGEALARRAVPPLAPPPAEPAPPRGSGSARRQTPIDISAEQRREIGVDHGGVAAPDEFHQRAHLVTHRDLREAHFVGEARSLALMVRISIGMHEDDGDGVDAVSAGGFERGARGGKVERRLHAAVGAHALRHLGDAHIEHRRLLDFAREDLWPRLIADLERVAEAFAHQQQHAIALALEQRIGGDRGAHLDAVDQLRRERLRRAQRQAGRRCLRSPRPHRPRDSPRGACGSATGRQAPAPRCR